MDRAESRSTFGVGGGIGEAICERACSVLLPTVRRVEHGPTVENPAALLSAAMSVTWLSEKPARANVLHPTPPPCFVKLFVQSVVQPVSALGRGFCFATVPTSMGLAGIVEVVEPETAVLGLVL